MPRLVFLSDIPIVETRIHSVFSLFARVEWPGAPTESGEDILARPPWGAPKTSPGSVLLRGDGLDDDGGEIQEIEIQLPAGYTTGTPGIHFEDIAIDQELFLDAVQSDVGAIGLLSGIGWEMTGTDRGDWLGPYLTSSGTRFDGDDAWTGGKGDDRFHGAGGDDTLRGGAGQDSLVAGPGQDRLWGGPGNDLLDGRQDAYGPDANHLRGGPGQDTLLAGGGFDKLWGGRGHDTLVGYEHSDVLRGGRGDDLIYALRSDAPRPIILTQAGPYFGGPGDDTIHSGGAEMIGGPGADTFVMTKGWGPSSIRDFSPDLDVIVLLDGATPEDIIWKDYDWGTRLEIGDYWLNLNNVSPQEIDPMRDFVWAENGA